MIKRPVGRPPIGEKAMDAMIKLTIDSAVVAWIDSQRGKLSRAAYMRAMIDAFRKSQLAQSHLNKSIRGAA